MITYSQKNDVMIFDMVSLSPTEADKPSQCWLLIKNPEKLNAYAIDTYFLVSARLKKSQHLGHILKQKGLLTPLEEAERYFQDLLDGKLTPAILKPLIGHLEATADLSDKEGLEKERILFGQQFLSPVPRRGLMGFLEKRDKRFQLGLKTRKSIMGLLDWIRHPIDNSFQ